MAGFLSGACLVLFVVYSLYFYIVEQRDVVMLIHYVKSGVFDPGSTLPVAILGTALCLIPAVLLLSLFSFPIRVKALALMPSYILLGLMTGSTPDTQHYGMLDSPLWTAVVLMFVAAVAIVSALLYHEDRGEHSTFQVYLAPNLFLTCVSIVMTLSLTAADVSLHGQLQLEHAVFYQDWEKAAVTDTALDCQNNNVTSMHVYALSRQGRLPEELFQTKGLCGSASLLPDTSETMRMYGIPKSIYRYLSAVPAEGFDGGALKFLRRALDNRRRIVSDSLHAVSDSLQTRILVDYYLCALLLDRHLQQFVRELPGYYPIDRNLPRHYKEAYFLYQRQGHHVDIPYEDELTTTAYEDYCKERYFGTYWYYYYNVHC